MFIVHLAGHLGKDPETRYTPNGQKLTTFTMAVNQRKGKEDVTIWVRVVIWGDHLDRILSYLKKGSGVIVIGKMNPPQSYTDKEGRTQISLEVTAEMVEFSPFGRSDRNADGQGQTASANGSSAKSNTSSAYETPHNSSYEDGQYQAAGANYGGRATTSYGSQMGQGSGQAIDDDVIPF
jgi:single-strand DNA-binding protein